MVARTLVDSHIDQGARLLRALDDAGVAIDVAYWMLESERSDWRLVLALPLDNDSVSQAVRLSVFEIKRTVEDTDYLMDKLSVVGSDDRRVLALKKQLPRGILKPGYWLGGFWSRDEDVYVDDSYVYRVALPTSGAKNGTARKPRASRNGAVNTAAARHRGSARAGG
jgi:hypothetical protein